MNYKHITLGILFTMACQNLALANICDNGLFKHNPTNPKKGVENSTLMGVRKDLITLLGNDQIADAISKLTSKAGLRVQVAIVTGEPGHGQPHFSEIIEPPKDGIIDLDAFNNAYLKVVEIANKSRQPIINTSILISRAGQPTIYREDQKNADGLFENFLNAKMEQLGLTRAQLVTTYKSAIAGKVWYFVTRTGSSRPQDSVVIYDPSQK